MIDSLPLFLNKFSSEYLIRKDIIHEPPYGKTNNLHRRNQRRRSASRLPQS